MISRENKVIGGFVAVAMTLTFGGFLFTELPEEMLMAVLFFVGIIAPMVVNNYLNRRESR